MSCPASCDPSSLVKMGSDTSNVGAGAINRSESINLTLAALVAQVLPNGNLVINGHQQVRVNNELRDMQVSGIVRTRGHHPGQHRQSLPDRRSAHHLWRPGHGHRCAAAALWQPAVRHLDALVAARSGFLPPHGEAIGGGRKPSGLARVRTDGGNNYLIVAIDFLASFMALLRFDGQGGDGPRVQPLQRNGLAGLFAKP